MPNNTDAQVLQVFRRQARKNRLVYLVFAERCLVLPEAQAPQPDHDVHDGALKGLPVMIVRPSRRVQRSLRAAPTTTSWEVTPPALSFWKPWFEKGRGRQESPRRPFLRPFAKG